MYSGTVISRSKCQSLAKNLNYSIETLQTVPQLGFVGPRCKRFFVVLALFYNIIIDQIIFYTTVAHMAHRNKPGLVLVTL